MKRHDPVAGKLSKVIAEAFTELEEMKQNGVDGPTRAKIFEGIVRDVWPTAREWKYLCEECSDTGWVSGICRPGARCGRPFKLDGQQSGDYTGQGRCVDGHSYANPCFCEKGRKIWKALHPRSQQTEGDELAKVGKIKKPSFNRFGR